MRPRLGPTNEDVEARGSNALADALGACTTLLCWMNGDTVAPGAVALCDTNDAPALVQASVGVAIKRHAEKAAKRRIVHPPRIGIALRRMLIMKR